MWWMMSGEMVSGEEVGGVESAGEAHLLLLASRTSRGDALALTLVGHAVVVGCRVQWVVWYRVN